MITEDLAKTVETIAENALKASHELAGVSTEKKNAFLHRLADSLLQPDQVLRLITANEMDLQSGKTSGLSSSMLDRLKIDERRIESMAEGIRQVAALPDPVGEVIETKRHPKDFEIKKLRVPIGVIGIIYESRPNVTIDCAVLCLKSGNSTILRGGKEAFHSNTALAQIITNCLIAERLPEHAVQLIPTTDREALNTLLKLDSHVHCIIPRGGEALIRFVAENARMPVIKHYKGVCNVFINNDADLDIAESLTINAKCQRPSVCNAAENLLVHKDCLNTLGLPILKSLAKEGIELRVDPTIAKLLSNNSSLIFSLATEEDWQTEYVDKIIAVKAVDSLDDAIEFINSNGSGHSDLIITNNETDARRFQTMVDSSTVYWNVSTRFTDGFEFGLGAEIGISTDKLHARGPMGLVELTSYKYLVTGKGQIR